MGDSKNKAIYPGVYTSLIKIAEFARKVSQEAGFDSATTYHIELALDEAVTNVIEHAYGGESTGTIELKYKIDPKRLTIQIIDHGQPFHPEDVEEPDIHAPLEERENHGLGLFLMRSLMDEVHFDFNETNGNKLTLVKYLYKEFQD